MLIFYANRYHVSLCIEKCSFRETVIFFCEIADIIQQLWAIIELEHEMNLIYVKDSLYRIFETIVFFKIWNEAMSKISINVSKFEISLLQTKKLNYIVGIR